MIADTIKDLTVLGVFKRLDSLQRADLSSVSAQSLVDAVNAKISTTGTSFVNSADRSRLDLIDSTPVDLNAAFLNNLI